jgi:hypothetical protein
MARHVFTCLVLLLASSTSLVAAPVNWNYWMLNGDGTMPVGAQNITVTYSSADFHDVILGMPNWTPTSTWADGTILSNGLTPFHNVMQIFGGTATVNTLSFSIPVIDPVLAIWSLGSVVQGSASFVFTGLNPQNIVGGPSSEFGGSPLSLSGVTVSGLEGNGSIQFLGTYSSISWTNPQFENYYGFNVGVIDVVPEPSSLLLALVSLVGVMWRISRRNWSGRAVV